MFDDDFDPESSRNYAIRIPPELNQMGLPFDFPRDLLDEMPIKDGVIIVDIGHPGVRAYLEKEKNDLKTTQTMA
jgi:hypothetical protein